MRHLKICEPERDIAGKGGWERTELGYCIGVETGKYFLINWNVLDRYMHALEMKI